MTAPSFPGRRQLATLSHAIRRLPVLRAEPVTYVSSAWRSRQHRDDFATLRRYVFFIGHPRSGHSMVGSLLDAHRHVVVSHELDALRYVSYGYRRNQLLTLVIDRAEENAAAGRTSWGYSYAVPGQWQGRYDRLEVAGDKRGRRTTSQLANRPELLDKLAATVDLPMSIIQVIRNPVDNIATMWRRGKRPLEYQLDRYFRLARTTDDIAARVGPDGLRRVRLEDVIADPKARLAELCAFVGVDAPDDYLEACASIVFPTPKQTRDDAPWTPDLLADVARRSAEHEWLSGYDDPTAR